MNQAFKTPPPTTTEAVTLSPWTTGGNSCRARSMWTLEGRRHKAARHRAVVILISLNLSVCCRAWSSLPPIQTTRRHAASTNRMLSRSPYWSDEEDEERMMGYNDKYNGDDSQQFSAAAYEPDTLEWEVCNTDGGTAHILLPPSAVRLPSVIFHFTGGTFFGSAPSLWYRQLLEDLVRHTQAAIVATSIPLTLHRSPLQHVNLAKQIRQQFQIAYQDVLADEYGDEIQSVPICGIGHSLGARLMVVLSTLDNPNSSTASKRSSAFLPPPYKSFVLISFTNNNAVDGIPGLKQLVQASRQSEQAARDEQRGRRTRRPDDDFEGGYGDDEEYEELFGELQSLFSKQAKRIKKALTPSADDLEFFPTPDELWEALTKGKRYRVPNTLVVQFDNDIVDQSSKLATAIVGSSDVKYARLRGTHLTPISRHGATASKNNDQFQSRAGKLIGRIIAGNAVTEAGQEAFLELRQSIARYATEVVTKC